MRVLQDDGGELRVLVPPAWTTRAFFALADNHGVLLRGLRPDDENLEELFQRVLNEAENGEATPRAAERKGVGDEGFTFRET